MAKIAGEEEVVFIDRFKVGAFFSYYSIAKLPNGKYAIAKQYKDTRPCFLTDGSFAFETIYITDCWFTDNLGQRREFTNYKSCLCYIESLDDFGD